MLEKSVFIISSGMIVAMFCWTGIKCHNMWTNNLKSIK